MSYTIVYGRQFVKTNRGIIPLALCGSNNCTEFINGREVRERSWQVYANSKIEFTQQECIDYVKQYCGETYQEHFMQNGKWVDDAGWMRWVKNGIKTAKTIEEIKEVLPHQSLLCFLSVWKKQEFRKDNEWGSRIELRCYCDTTEQLEQWLDIAYERKSNMGIDDETIYICMEFMGREPLSLGNKKTPDGKVIVKRKRFYISEVGDGSWKKGTNDIKDALVFDSVEQVKEQIRDWKISKVQFVKAENKEIEKLYRILVKSKSYSSGYYVLKLTRSGLRGSHTPENAMRFTSEQAAQKYITDKLKPRFKDISEYSILKIA